MPCLVYLPFVGNIGLLGKDPIHLLILQIPFEFNWFPAFYFIFLFFFRKWFVKYEEKFFLFWSLTEPLVNIDNVKINIAMMTPNRISHVLMEWIVVWHFTTELMMVCYCSHLIQLDALFCFPYVILHVMYYVYHHYNHHHQVMWFHCKTEASPKLLWQTHLIQLVGYRGPTA